jgi:hypothetical protein
MFQERSSIMLRGTFAVLTMTVLLFVLLPVASTEVPHLINYQGMLTDDMGNPENGSYSFEFLIYDDTTGGDLKWSETQSGVQVQNGLFNVALGKQGALNLPFDESYWLEVRVGGETLPRVRLASVCYAYRAQVADSATVAVSASAGGGWVDEEKKVRLHSSGDNVGIGTGSPSAELDVDGDISGGSYYMAENARVLFSWGTLTYVGAYAGITSYVDGNTFAGPWAGGYAGGDSNTFVGDLAGYDTRFSTTNRANTYVGASAGSMNQEGMGNVLVGYGAGSQIVGGNYNTALGCSALVSLEHDVAFNTCLGNKVGYSNITGSGNVFLGYEAGYYETGSNKLYIANSRDTSDVLIYGDFESGRVGLGTLNPASRLHVASATSSYGMLRIENSNTGDNEATIGFREGSDASNTDIWVIGVAPWGNTNDFVIGRNQPMFLVTPGGRVGIGTTSPNYKLDVDGDINVSGSYNVKGGGTNYNHPDYVFEPDYELMPLNELKEYVSENKCLPNVITAEDVRQNGGFNMDELLIQMLEKVEENALYLLQLDEQLDKLESGQ